MPYQLIKPDSPDQTTRNKKSIFLAGSIEMGSASDWQKEVEAKLKKYDVTVFNPRRDDWDSSWKQTVDNPQFNYQVTWELEHLELADIIFMYLAPGTKSPISLLELGLFATYDKTLIVCCPEGFWRKGNVDIVLMRYQQEVSYNNLEEAVHQMIYQYID